MICGFGRGSGLGLVWPLQNNQLVIFVLEIWIRSFISLASWNRLGLLLIQDLPLKSIQFTKTAGSKNRSFVEVRRRFPQDRPRSALNWGRKKFSIFGQFFIWYHFPLSPPATTLISKDVEFSCAFFDWYKKFVGWCPSSQTPTQKS